MKKIRIYINAVVPGSDKFSGKTGSVVRMCNIVGQFNKIDKNVEIIVNATKWMVDYLRESGMTNARYRIIKTSLKFKGYFGLVFKTALLTIKLLLVRKLPKVNKDTRVVAYSSSDLFWEVIPAYIYKIRNKKIEWVQVIHHIYPDWKKRPGSKIINFFGYILQRFSLFLIRNADKVIVVNDIVSDQLERFGIKREKIFVNPNGIDYDYFQSIEAKSGYYDGVFLARLNHSKGIFDLIEIWERVIRNFPSARLAVIGGGDEDTKKEMRKRINECGLEKKIELLGFLPDEEAHQILKSGKVFIFPSHEEGWGIAVAEAMACGLPVVSWNLPAYKTVFENFTVQIKENEIDEFAKAVVKFLQNNDFLIDYGNKGREFVKKYSWENVASHELEIIKN